MFYNLHNLQSTKDMFFVFLYLEMGMERPSKGKSNGWSDNNLSEAPAEIENNSASIRKIAAKYNITE